MNLFFLFVLFLQVWTALSTRCRTHGGELGLCKFLHECNAPHDMSRLLAKCADTGRHCCPPNESTGTLQKKTIDATIPSSTGSKFPRDCGDTPKYVKEQIVGGKEIEPDEYSWLASLQYGNSASYGFCGGSVINSRYVLTAAHCVVGEKIRNVGGLTGLRLGDFNVNGTFCDYGTNNCTHYQQFGIDKIITHSDYRRNLNQVLNDIALIRVDRPIQFASKMKPVCLPFGENQIPEPAVGTMLTVAGWGLTMEENEKPAKRDVSIQLWETDKCNEVFRVDETHLCAAEAGKNSCNGDSGGPLMSEFVRRRMVLEGIVSYGIRDCKNNNYPGVYTRVRNYYNWLNQQMEI